MDGWFVISLIDVQTKHAKLLKLLLEGGGRAGGHMFDRQKCSEKWQSVILNFDLTEIIRDVSFVVSFIHVPINMQNR